MVAAHVSPMTHEPQPNLLVFDLTIGPFSRTAIDSSPYICSFFFPSPGPWTAGLDIVIQSSPAPSHMPDPTLSVPFFTCLENRIFVVTILLTDGHSIQTYVIFIPSSTLTEHIAALPCKKGRVNIPWDAWGPTGTRMLPSPGHSSVWVCYVYGMRFVAPHEVRGTDSTTIRVYDFSSLPIKRAIAAGHESDDSTSYVTAATFLDTWGAFEDIVTTSLPYRMSQLSLERDDVDGGQFGAVMCSEDNLIIVGVRDFTSASFMPLMNTMFFLSYSRALVLDGSVYSLSEVRGNGYKVSTSPGSTFHPARASGPAIMGPTSVLNAEADMSRSRQQY